MTRSLRSFYRVLGIFEEFLDTVSGFPENNRDLIGPVASEEIPGAGELHKV